MELIRPTRHALETFKTDLWKDQRKLSQKDQAGLLCLEKTFLSPEEAEIETNLLRHLENTLTVAKVPRVLASGATSITMPYIKGARLFNLFVELDQLTPPLDVVGRAIKRRLLTEANARQADIQRALMNFEFGRKSRVYPAGRKVRAIIDILAGCLGMHVDAGQLDKELADFDDRWAKFAYVPFRDATCKNMVLAAEQLWIGNFEGEAERTEYLKGTLSQDGLPEWVYSPVVDFDFSSCVELSTPEDDPISINFHERTWSGSPDVSRSLNWRYDQNAERAALTFIVRYYRFGGRKAAYRLLHPWGHRVRFRYDSDQFYFARLSSIVRAVWGDIDTRMPYLMEITEQIGRNLGTVRADIDYFIGEGLGDKRTYYVDMYVEK